ncbi:hypothetical protein GGR56DRAFT_674357 [Xylariaceae sp. FL0804]|nr:hypothetical protein GGR56DRAFT_674357 [Xylariaceae sp. FL0804]
MFAAKPARRRAACSTRCLLALLLHHHPQRRAISLSAPCRSPPPLSASEAAARMLRELGGAGATLQTRRQDIDANQLDKLAATLGRQRQRPSGGIAASTGIEGEGPEGEAEEDELMMLEGSDGTGTGRRRHVPPGHHLVYFTPGDLERDLGPDGTDTAPRPPPPFTRRMWAGGRMRWPARSPKPAQRAGAHILSAGDRAEEVTRLLGVTAKKSRAGGGEMLLVEVEKEIRVDGRPAVVDTRSWIFRPALDPSSSSSYSSAQHHDAAGEKQRRPDADEVSLLPWRGSPSVIEDVPAGVVAGVAGDGVTSSPSSSPFPARRLRWSPVGLFRFSALTFNGHQIHYSADWARGVEGHPGLVVHGPLNLVCILDYWRDVHGRRGHDDPAEVRYRAVAPVYAGETYYIRTEAVVEEEEEEPGEKKEEEVEEEEGGRARRRRYEINVVKEDGVVCMTSEVWGPG